MISIQNEDFSLGDEYAAIRTRAGDAGAIVTFTGLVERFMAMTILQLPCNH